jgi:CO dehydrogenase maturation factor
MKGIIAVCGKGGVGKTTVSSLLCCLVMKQQDIRGLAVDADPAGGLSMTLSLPAKKTVNDLRKSVIAAKKSSLDSLNIAASIDFQLLDALTEIGNLAFLAVGRPEEAGCYCQVNTFLRESIEALVGHFDVTIIDGEAGIEQVNRRVIGKVDLLLLVSDMTLKGIQVAETIKKVAEEAVTYKRVGLLLNRARYAQEVSQIAQATELPLLGWLPEDENIHLFEAHGRSLLELSDSPSFNSIRNLTEELFSEK